jgi:hypothetical protein
MDSRKLLAMVFGQINLLEVLRKIFPKLFTSSLPEALLYEQKGLIFCRSNQLAQYLLLPLVDICRFGVRLEKGSSRSQRN